MAQYQIINPEIRTIEQGKQNAGNKFLRCTLKNKRCFWEEGQTYVNFMPEVVAAFESVLPIDKGGKAQQAQPLPLELSTIEGCWVNWKPAQMFYKKHLSDHPAQPAVPASANNPGRAARPAIKAGELVGEKGNPTIFTTLRVFCIYYVDEFGEKTWIRGNSPDEVGQRAFSNYCVPITENHNPQTIPTTQEPEIVGGVDYTNQQPAAQPQPQSQFPFAPQTV